MGISGCHFPHDSDLHVRCLEKVSKTLSQMVVKDGDLPWYNSLKKPNKIQENWGCVVGGN